MTKNIFVATKPSPRPHGPPVVFNVLGVGIGFRVKDRQRRGEENRATGRGHGAHENPSFAVRPSSSFRPHLTRLCDRKGRAHSLAHLELQVVYEGRMGASIYDVRTEGGGGLAKKKM